MYNIACKDMGMEACPFVAQDESMEGAMMKLKEHGSSTHATEMEQMMAGGMTEEGLMEKMKAVATQS